MSVAESVRKSWNRVWFRLPTRGRLIIGLFVLVVSGTVLMVLPISSTHGHITWNQAMFTAVSALTVTGLSIIVPSQDLSFIGQVFLLLLIQIGGAGFMVLATIVLRILKMEVSLEDRVALRESLGLGKMKGIVTLTWNAILGVALIESIGAAALWLHWRNLPLPPVQTGFYAIFHAVSAMCNAGFDLFTGMPQFPDGMPNDTVTLIILSTLIFLGSIGIPVYTDLFSRPRGRRLTLHSRLVLSTSLILIIGGGLVMFFAERNPAGVLHGLPIERAAALATYQSISARTAGFAGLPNFTQITPASQLVLVVLMFIGGSPASMGGGVKTSTLAVLVLSLLSYARAMPEVHFSRRRVSKANIQKAGAVLVAGLGIALAATMVLLLAHPDSSLAMVLFEVVSAFGTCGLTLGFTSQLGIGGQILIMVVMFWGRLGALSLVAAMTQPRRKMAVNYAEDQVLIG